MSEHIDCFQLNEIRVDVHRGPLETFAEHSGLWLNGDEQAEDKALQDGEFIEFGLGNINNGICLNKVSNG